MSTPIDKFQGATRWLSNFEEAEVVIDGHVYATNEHAFQALKADNEQERRWVASAPTPREAKKRGRQVRMRPDWEDVKVHVMRTINRDKFTRHAHLRDKLLATGDAELIEGNTWGDRFWGVCAGEGTNWLGKILMEIRSELRSDFDPLREQLADMNPDALLADGFDEALVGIGYRCGQDALAVYDVEKAAHILIERDGLSYGEAMEFLEFNTIGSWVGPHTPIWMYPRTEEE